MSNRFEKLGYKQYQELTDADIKEKYDYIISQWEVFLRQNDTRLQLNIDYFVHQRNLYEVIKQWDKRVLYFLIFHNMLEENEYKEIAIISFWINNLKPFMVIKEDSKIYNAPNEMFSLHLILSTIAGAYKKKYPDKVFKFPSTERIKDILYDFKYCSLSREAMIAFVETLADTYGVGISYILDKKTSTT